jgi:hypothetical protein
VPLLAGAFAFLKIADFARLLSGTMPGTRKLGVWVSGHVRLPTLRNMDIAATGLSADPQGWRVSPEFPATAQELYLEFQKIQGQFVCRWLTVSIRIDAGRVCGLDCISFEILI